jgi:hypothetical protein
MATSWEHLLGGYATNTLTDEEKRQLFEAALHDQFLFDALADEEALKAILADPEARQRILASLQATDYSGVAKKSEKWWGWFRQPSSLAWAGRIAAVGLALIFGWQMEKEWGPVVSQEQEAAKSSSRDEVAFRSEKPSEKPTGAVPKEALEENVNQAEGRKVEPPSIPDRASREETNKVDRLREVPAMAKQESDAREMGQAMRRQRGNEQVAQAPPPSSPSSRSKFEPSVQPLAVPQSPEVALPEIAPQAKAPGRFADRAVEDLPQTPPGAQELFYASSGFLADEVITEKKDKDRMDQGSDQSLRGGISKELNHSSKKKALSFPLERDVAVSSAIPTARGIRYSFVRYTKEGKDQEVDAQQIKGNWSQIRLAVESNVSGYLYVLAPLDNGKWQNLVPLDPEQTKKTEGGIKVKSFQRVEYALDQLMPTSGQPVVPSLTLLLSPAPPENLSQWLGREVDMSEFQIERAEGAVFVVQPTLEKGNPLHLVIP